MASNKNPLTAGLEPLKIGSRVRCTDNGLVGRIVWANGVSVKITWDNGEQVTWRRDALAGRPIEILAGDENQSTAPTPAVEPTRFPAAETPPTVPESAPKRPAAETPVSEPTTVETPPTAEETATATEAPSRASGPTEAAIAPTEAATATTEAVQTAKPKRQRKTSAEPKEKKLSALDAAAKVLGDAGQAMTCQGMIDAMASKGYWTSLGGQTPDATLYSAIAREITTKGEQGAS